jgi:hypothetical protein
MKKKNARLTEAKPSANPQAHFTTRPRIDGDPIVFATSRRVRGVWIIKLTCPHCGEKHTHGGGGGLVPHGGHRVAHCRNSTGKGYFIKLAEEAEAQHDDLC